MKDKVCIQMIVHNNYFEQYCIYMYRGCCSVTVEGVHGKAPKWYLIDSKILLAKCFPFHSMKKENLTRNQESLKAFFSHTLSVVSSQTYLNLGGSIGSFCISTIRMTLCLAPELKANPCWEGVYLMYCAAWGFCATWVGCAAAILVVTSFSSASLVFLVVCT